MLAYNGPWTLKQFFPFYTYGPTSAAVLSLSWHVRFRLWLATVICGPFVWTGPLPEDAEHWQPTWHGDCVSFAFLLRRVCKLLALPEGAFSLLYCTTGTQPGDWSKGHMALAAETDQGCLVCEVGKRTWKPWSEYGFFDWNREKIGD